MITKINLWDSTEEKHTEKLCIERYKNIQCFHEEIYGVWQAIANRFIISNFSNSLLKIEFILYSVNKRYYKE